MHEIVNLADPGCPLRIEYLKPAMEQIRRRARAGLMAAPRVGMAVGGLLLGVREASNGDSRIRILDSVDLPCSHSSGPSFTLTEEEINESREMVAEANALSATSKVSVVGWYCSKMRGEAVLSDSDHSFFADLFPGAGQIALVLRPDIFESMRAVFHFRDEHGAVMKGPACEVDEWFPVDAPPVEPLAETLAEPAAPPQAPDPPPESPKVIAIRQLAPKPAEPAPAPIPVMAAAAASGETSLKDILGLAADPIDPPPAPTPRSALFVEPAFLLPPPRQASRLPLIVAAVGALILLIVAAYFTRDSWFPKPPLSLTFSEDSGSLLIHWDPDAVRGVDHASLYVNDGGQPAPTVIPLDRLELNQGLFSYARKSKRVTAKLDAGSTSAFSSWFAPEPPKPAAPKADTDATGSPSPVDTQPAALAPALKK